MATALLKFGFYALGLSAILIGCAFILFGPDATGQFFNALLRSVVKTPDLTGLDSVNGDSELRFYSVFWIAYGVLLIDCARNLKARAARAPVLIGLFFAGGLARAIGVVASGLPHPFFTALLIIELVLPLILWACWIAARRRGD